MSRSLLQFLDALFLVFHTGFTAFNLVGWIFPWTRGVHRVTMVLTTASWFVLGAWFGWGYCVCTDWHWQVRAALGNPITTRSYIRFLVTTITGVELDPILVDRGTAIVYALLVVVTVGGWVRDRRRA